MKTLKINTKISLIMSGLLISLALQTRQAFAQHPLEQADKEYAFFNYAKAIPLYLQAFKTDSSYHISSHLANAYRLIQDYKNAETWYAVSTPTYFAKPDEFLRYAQVLQSNAKYAEAKEQFIQYYARSPEIDQSQLSVWLGACDSAIVWMNNPRPFIITNERGLNSAKSDWGVSVYNNAIVFASDRKRATAKGLLRFDVDKPVNPGSYLWTGNDYLRLYQAQPGSASELALFKLAISATDYHIGPASFTADANEMYFTLTRLPKEAVDDTAIKTIKPEIFRSTKTANGEWSKPLPFTYNNPKYSAGDPFITPDGQTLYFVSDMPGGKGGTDIYYCKKGSGDSWEKPVNLSAVNTTGNERTPVLYAGKLYFSSADNTGMGGLDVYSAGQTDNGFAKAQNMGYPVNSPQDDFAFMPTGATTGYLSSNRPGGVGSDDIYSYVQKSVPTFAFEGIVYDKQTNEVIPNSMVTLTNADGRLVTTQSSAAGKFKFTLDQKSNYTLHGEKVHYLSDNQILSTLGTDPSAAIRKNLYLDRIVLNQPVRLPHLYLDITEAYITDDARNDMDKLIRILKDNPTIVIEISAHTDSRGNASHNIKLSQDCSNTVVQYLIDKGGINPRRIKARGYGATALLNGCKVGVKCIEAEHMANRRVEYRVTRL